MERFLASTDVIDWRHPDVLAQARALRNNIDDSVEVTKRCFEWVRDEIRHSHDYCLTPVTCSASEVLSARSGYCYAKSHLLAALLRANEIAAGLCYQRLSRDGDGSPYSLHGLNAVMLPKIGWYRVDPRGNRSGVEAQFTPPVEQLAFFPGLPGEADLPGVWADPLPVVVKALQSYATADALWDHLPDIQLDRSENWSIRSATVKDADTLAAFAERTFRDTYAAENSPADMDAHVARSFSPGQIRNELTDSSITTLVAEDQPNSFVAYAQLRVSAPPPCVTGSHLLELWRFYVDQPYHGHGVAQALMDAVLGIAIGRGATTLWLGVWEPNRRAQAFYRKAGFEEIGTHTYVLGSDRQADSVFVRPLNGSTYDT